MGEIRKVGRYVGGDRCDVGISSCPVGWSVAGRAHYRGVVSFLRMSGGCCKQVGEIGGCV